LLWRLDGATFGWAGVVWTGGSNPVQFASMNYYLMVVESNPNYEIFIMDNVTSPPAFPNTCVIKLDEHQYKFYKKSRLEIQSPNGRVLTVMSKPLKNKTEADAVFQLWCQACLLEVLFDEIQDKIKLPQKAINDFVRIIDRIDLHLKEQLRM
jgi:hypothetical protein